MFPPESPPIPGALGRRKLVVAVFLVLQFALPLSYYASDDPMDERFAWRMFSPIRMVTCDARFVEQGPEGTRTVKLTEEVPEVWDTWVKRGHARVIRRVGTHICERRSRLGPEIELRARVLCKLPDGREVKPVPWEEDLCRN